MVQVPLWSLYYHPLPERRQQMLKKPAWARSWGEAAELDSGARWSASFWLPCSCSRPEEWTWGRAGCHHILFVKLTFPKSSGDGRFQSWAPPEHTTFSSKMKAFLRTSVRCMPNLNWPFLGCLSFSGWHRTAGLWADIHSRKEGESEMKGTNKAPSLCVLPFA